MDDQLTGIETQATADLLGVADAKTLDEWRIAYLGRSGKLTQVLRALGSLPAEQRRDAGARANEVKRRLETLLDEAETALKQAELARSLLQGRIDVTLPGRPVAPGRLHPITQIVREICATFEQLGFQIAEGPEVELD